MIGRRVEIELEGGNEQIFHPGNPVTGYVDYRSLAEDRVDSVTIDFRGISTVKSSATVKAETVELFHQQEILHAKDATFPPRVSRRWQFTFMVPNITAPDQTGTYSEDAAETFDSKPHPLPPDFRTQSRHGQASIVYNLYAVALRAFQEVGAGELRQEPIHKTLNLSFLPLIDDSLTHLATLSVEKTISTMPQAKKSFL